MPSQQLEPTVVDAPRATGRRMPRAKPTARQGRSKGGRPTRQATAELDRRILDAAADLFAAQGFAATSMEQVAAACGSGKDTIYRRYPSKLHLFRALMARLRAQVVQELEERATGYTSPIERLRGYARALLSIYLRPEVIALNRVALAEAAMLVGDLYPIPIARDAIMPRLGMLLEETLADGAVAATGEPSFVAEQLFHATLVSPLISRMVGEERFSTRDAEDAHFDQAWDLFMKGASLASRERLPLRSMKRVVITR